MYKFATSIGLDIGRTMIRTAIARYDGKIFESFRFPYKKHPDRELLLEYIVSAVKATRNKSVDHNVNPLCVGIAAKGLIDYDKGIVLGPDRGIKGWTDVELSKIISENTGLPVFIDNDANLMLLSETSFGSASGKKNILFVALRSGIGGAIIIDGKIHRGINNAAGEIGQMSLNFEGPKSKTGIIGSFEYYASSFALVRDYFRLAEDSGPEKTIGSENFRAKDVFNLSYNGDKNAILAVENNARFVGLGLANLISIFSPQIIVLGGGMSLARDSYFESIRKSAEENSLEYCFKGVKIERASLGYSGALLGASFYALTRLDGKYI